MSDIQEPLPTLEDTSSVISDIAAFKKRRQGTVLLLPSGLRMMCQRVELQVFLRQGAIPNNLMSIVESALQKGQQVDMDQLINPEKLDMDLVNEMYETVNAVVIGCSIDPKVHAVPAEETDRSDEILYVDEVDDEDKMFLFQWSSGGTADVAQFRKEAAAGLVSLVPGQGTGSTTESTD